MEYGAVHRVGVLKKYFMQKMSAVERGGKERGYLGWVGIEDIAVQCSVRKCVAGGIPDTVVHYIKSKCTLYIALQRVAIWVSQI